MNLADRLELEARQAAAWRAIASRISVLKDVIDDQEMKTHAKILIEEAERQRKEIDKFIDGCRDA